MKTIVHLDMNSYFATAEQQANPYLRGKPVGVIKSLGRGCVIAASVEAKRCGVKTGTTVWEAKKLCPQICLVPSDTDKYFALTKRLMKIAYEFSPVVEIFSIDEFFLDVSESQKIFPGGVWQIAVEMKTRVREELGEWMRCSVGIGFSKLVAKLASEMRKPDGLTWLTESNYLAETESVEVSEVCGIGHARTRYLASRGANSLGQARMLPDLPEDISKLVWLKEEKEMEEVEDLAPAKSVSRTFTTFKELKDEGDVKKLVRNLVEEATQKLREMKMLGRTFSLSLRSQGSDKSFWARRTIFDATDDPLIVFQILWSSYVGESLDSVRFAGVNISNLSFGIQTSIFGRRSEFLEAVDLVNNKYGLFTLYPAGLVGGTLIRPEVTGYLGDKYYRFGKMV